MEENTEQISKQTEDTQWEQLPWNKHDRYIPTEFQVIDFQKVGKSAIVGVKLG